MRKTLMALVCGAVLTVSAFAADLTGDWKAEMQTRNGDKREVTFKLKQDGNALTGTMVGAQGRSMEISNGKVDGDNVSFDTKMNTPNGEMNVNYSGTISGDELKLKRQMNGGQGGGGGGRGGNNELVAKRVKVS